MRFRAFLSMRSVHEAFYPQSHLILFPDYPTILNLTLESEGSQLYFTTGSQYQSKSVLILRVQFYSSLELFLAFFATDVCLQDINN